NVVVLVRLQLPAGRLLVSKYLVDCGVDLFEVSRADELLQHRDVRMASCIQSKAFWKGFEQAGIIRLRMLNHRLVRLERNIDCHPRISLRASSFRMPEQQRKADVKRGNDFYELKHQQAPDESAN